MVALSALWLPIVVSAVVVFIASFLAWVVLPHHKKDWHGLKNEEPLREALKGVPPGQYMVPFCADPKTAQSPEMKQKYDEGPNGFIYLKPNGYPNMGKNMLFSFIFYLVVSFLTAYVASHTVNAGADYLDVFRVVGATAMLAYAAGFIPNAIWFGRGFGATFKEVLDGIVYGLLTAGVFGWLWPGAA